MVGRLLVPLCRRSAVENVSVNGQSEGTAQRQGSRWTVCAVGVAHLGSRSAGQVRGVHGKSTAESVPRRRCIFMCDVPAWRYVSCTYARVAAKVARCRVVLGMLMWWSLCWCPCGRALDVGQSGGASASEAELDELKMKALAQWRGFSEAKETELQQ